MQRCLVGILTLVVLAFGAVAGAAEPAQFGRDMPSAANSPAEDPFACRKPPLKAELLEKLGGNEATEAAVIAALQWIADHQMPDGGWCFDHRIGPVINGRPRTSDHPGFSGQARRAATAMAILPFLGAGQTHKDGAHKTTVQGGLKYLINNMKPDGALNEAQGNMYSHGLASIAFCEAYGMTGDNELKAAAQASLSFTEYAQDPVGGGWRYSPRQPGDTSVFGWQMMAPQERRIGSTEGESAGDPRGDPIPGHGSGKRRLVLWIYQSRARAGDYGHRAAVPNVLGLDTRERGIATRRRMARQPRPFDGKRRQHVLQLLRHPSLPAIRGRSLGEMELQDAQLPGQQPIQSKCRPKAAGSLRAGTAPRPAGVCTIRRCRLWYLRLTIATRKWPPRAIQPLWAARNSISSSLAPDETVVLTRNCGDEPRQEKHPWGQALSWADSFRLIAHGPRGHK